MEDKVLEALLDKQAITEVIYRYCRGIDRFDFELVKSCFHADAIAYSSPISLNITNPFQSSSELYPVPTTYYKRSAMPIGMCPG